MNTTRGEILEGKRSTFISLEIIKKFQDAVRNRTLSLEASVGEDRCDNTAHWSLNKKFTTIMQEVEVDEFHSLAQVPLFRLVEFFAEA